MSCCTHLTRPLRWPLTPPRVSFFRSNAFPRCSPQQEIVNHQRHQLEVHLDHVAEVCGAVRLAGGFAERVADARRAGRWTPISAA
jgi:hypothetical protein